MTGWAIVAIPDEQDPVWKYSSEKIPHMTLLFIGEQDGKLDVDRVSEYIAHVTSSSLRPFGLSVDHRGELGPDRADVLFFSDEYGFLGTPKKARDYFLANSDIKQAYDSVEQWPQWTPHLTMGYPESPAKEDDRDYPGFSWVRFKKIALWTGEFTGPEFLLENPETESEFAMADTVQEFLEHRKILTAERKELEKKGAAMPGGRYPIKTAQDLSNAIRAVGETEGEEERNKVRRHIIKQAKRLDITDKIPDTWNSDGSLKHSALDDFLKHFGVKGMKWGVRRRTGDRVSSTPVRTTTVPGSRVRTTGGKGQGPSDDAVRVAISKQTAKKSSTDALSTKDLQELVNRMNLEQQYNKLAANEPNSMKRGMDVTKGLLQTANTANQVISAVNSPAGKLVRELISAKVRK